MKERQLHAPGISQHYQQTAVWGNFLNTKYKQFPQTYLFIGNGGQRVSYISKWPRSSIGHVFQQFHCYWFHWFHCCCFHKSECESSKRQIRAKTVSGVFLEGKKTCGLFNISEYTGSCNVSHWVLLPKVIFLNCDIIRHENICPFLCIFI